MNIDSINILLSWENIRDMLRDSMIKMPVSDIDIKYDKCIVISGKYLFKIEIPFSIKITRIACSQGSIILDIGDIEAYVRIPLFFRDALVNSLIKNYDGKIIFEGNALIIRRELISSLLPFEEYTISSISAGEKYLKVDLKDIKMQLNTGLQKD